MQEGHGCSCEKPPAIRRSIYLRMAKILHFSISRKHIHHVGFGLVSVNKALMLRAGRLFIERKALSISV